MKRLLTALIVGVLVLGGAPAEARDLKKGEVVVCTKSKVRLWEDGSASCVKPTTYKWKTWGGFKVGDYIKCKRVRDIEVDNLNKQNTAQWAHCDD